jgi:hypothetical protein
MWERIFTSPEDDTWHLVSDGESYGLNHECERAGAHPLVGKSNGCSYCGAKEPEALWGLYKMVEWER